MGPVPVYSVNPDRVTIAPKSSCQLEFFGFSAQPGQIEERFICTLGNGVKSKQTVFDIVARSVVNIDIVARSVVNIDIFARSVVVNMPPGASQQHLEPCEGTCLHSGSSFLLDHERIADTICSDQGGAVSAHFACGMMQGQHCSSSAAVLRAQA